MQFNTSNRFDTRGRIWIFDDSEFDFWNSVFSVASVKELTYVRFGERSQLSWQESACGRIEAVERKNMVSPLIDLPGLGTVRPPRALLITGRASKHGLVSSQLQVVMLVLVVTHTLLHR